MNKKHISKWRYILRLKNIITHAFCLSELSSCKIYDEQIQYCLKSLKLISSGSYRLTFENNDTVLKVAKMSAGLISNYNEATQAKLCTKLFPEIINIHEAKKNKYDYIVVEKVIPFDNTIIKKYTGVSWEELFSLVIFANKKDIKDQKIRQIWNECYFTQMKFNVNHISKLYDEIMSTENPVKQFIQNVSEYLSNFELSLHPIIISDYKCLNLGWSEKNKSIVVLDNGNDAHMNIIGNNGKKNKMNKKLKSLQSMIQNEQINSTTILQIRNSK